VVIWSYTRLVGFTPTWRAVFPLRAGGPGGVHLRLLSGGDEAAEERARLGAEVARTALAGAAALTLAAHTLGRWD
jgi:hypothetical protein